MDEVQLGWLIGAGIVTLILVMVLHSRRTRNLRREHFGQLASLFGAAVEEPDEYSLRFSASIGDRDFEVRDGTNFADIGSDMVRMRYLTLTTPLRGRSWDLHDVRISFRRQAEGFDERFRIEQFGLPLPDRWLTEQVRRAMLSFPSGPGPEILIEKGNLVFRSRPALGQFTPEGLRETLTHLADLATALGRARNR